MTWTNYWIMREKGQFKRAALAAAYLKFMDYKPTPFEVISMGIMAVGIGLYAARVLPLG